MENIMQHDVTAENYDRISLSDYEGGLWMSIWKVGAHCSIHLNQEQIKEFHKAIGEYIKETADEL
jgi:quinol monooxygenase YgiN